MGGTHKINLLNANSAKCGNVSTTGFLFFFEPTAGFAFFLWFLQRRRPLLYIRGSSFFNGYLYNFENPNYAEL